MFVYRDFSDRLAELSRGFPAVAVTGARQTGKTAILRNLYPDAEFLSFDLPSVVRAASTDPELFVTGLKGRRVILDEVQYAPEVFRILKAAIDADRHTMGRFLMTGSQKLPLMKGLSESLAGRIGIVELETFSAGEMRRVDPEFEKPAVMMRYLHRGGFPELYRNPELKPLDFYSAYVVTYLERDLRAMLRVGDLSRFETFLKACAFRSGQILNLADLARDARISPTTAAEWMSVLEATNQVSLLQPYFHNFGKRLIKAPKLYLRDTGLVCFLLGIDSPEAMRRSPFAGAIWETFVYGELRRWRQRAQPSSSIWYWRDAHGVEVDFVVVDGGFAHLVEAKFTELPDAADFAGVKKVAALMGPYAAERHVVACLTTRAFRVMEAPRLDAVGVGEWMAREMAA